MDTVMMLSLSYDMLWHRTTSRTFQMDENSFDVSLRAFFQIYNSKKPKARTPGRRPKISP